MEALARMSAAFVRQFKKAPVPVLGDPAKIAARIIDSAALLSHSTADTPVSCRKRRVEIRTLMCASAASSVSA